MPDTEERVGGDWVEIPFPRRKSIVEARVEVRDALDEIHPQWRSHLKMVNEPRSKNIRNLHQEKI